MPIHVLGGFIVHEKDDRCDQVSGPLPHPERPTIDRRARVTTEPGNGSDGNAGLAAGAESRTERDDLGRVMCSLLTRSPDVEAVALISVDGRMMASALPQEIDETRAAGMTATLVSLGARAAAELGRGSVEDVIVRGDHGYAVILTAGREVLLLTLANGNARLGLVFFDMREAITEVKRSLVSADDMGVSDQVVTGRSPA